jgi:metal transporter CNNM
MVPASIAIRNTHSIRSLIVLLQLAAQHARQHLFSSHDGSHPLLFKREAELALQNKKVFIVFAALIPVLVLLSGVFAGLTLGYMSLDMTQLTVLSMSGTP